MERERGPVTDVNIPEVVDEVGRAFAAYEAALAANDVRALDAAFWDDQRVVRLGIAESLYGGEAIAAYRRSCPPPRPRSLLRTLITTFGRDVGTAVVEYREPGATATGRQSQTWVRRPEGWRIVAAHVSLLGVPGDRHTRIGVTP